MEVGKWEDSAMTRNRGEGDFVMGNVDPMDRARGAESDQPGKLTSIRFRVAVHGGHFECRVRRD